ncbi:MAG: Asp-tRNA(Asn)/Glu-tRNA(Gln) amidotransferase subunit GatC [Candidatus Omnitrophica bacterium]|nr:Asp-tRNA(Asn)/Glu-tRNA(Gln) amidotransferase subunit GatC [Candidatus Omnitrophota bacterium]
MITKKDVQYVAHLSRIHLSDEEVERFTKNLEDILGYIEKLNKLDVSSVKPTSHVLPLKNVFRKDESRPSLMQKDVIKLSAESDKGKGAFKVPQVIE